MAENDVAVCQPELEPTETRSNEDELGFSTNILVGVLAFVIYATVLCVWPQIPITLPVTLVTIGVFCYRGYSQQTTVSSQTSSTNQRVEELLQTGENEERSSACSQPSNANNQTSEPGIRTKTKEIPSTTSSQAPNANQKTKQTKTKAKQYMAASQVSIAKPTSTATKSEHFRATSQASPTKQTSKVKKSELSAASSQGSTTKQTSKATKAKLATASLQASPAKQTSKATKAELSTASSQGSTTKQTSKATKPKLATASLQASPTKQTSKATKAELSTASSQGSTTKQTSKAAKSERFTASSQGSTTKQISKATKSELATASSQASPTKQTNKATKAKLSTATCSSQTFNNQTSKASTQMTSAKHSTACSQTMNATQTAESSIQTTSNPEQCTASSQTSKTKQSERGFQTTINVEQSMACSQTSKPSQTSEIGLQTKINVDRSTMRAQTYKIKTSGTGLQTKINVEETTVSAQTTNTQTSEAGSQAMANPEQSTVCSQTSDEQTTREKVPFDVIADKQIEAGLIVVDQDHQQTQEFPDSSLYQTFEMYCTPEGSLQESWGDVVDSASTIPESSSHNKPCGETTDKGITAPIPSIEPPDLTTNMQLESQVFPWLPKGNASETSTIIPGREIPVRLARRRVPTAEVESQVFPWLARGNSFETPTKVRGREIPVQLDRRPVPVSLTGHGAKPKNPVFIIPRIIPRKSSRLPSESISDVMSAKKGRHVVPSFGKVWQSQDLNRTQSNDDADRSLSPILLDASAAADSDDTPASEQLQQQHRDEIRNATAGNMNRNCSWHEYHDILFGDVTCDKKQMREMMRSMGLQFFKIRGPQIMTELFNLEAERNVRKAETCTPPAGNTDCQFENAPMVAADETKVANNGTEDFVDCANNDTTDAENGTKNFSNGKTNVDNHDTGARANAVEPETWNSSEVTTVNDNRTSNGDNGREGRNVKGPDPTVNSRPNIETVDVEVQTPSFDLYLRKHVETQLQTETRQFHKKRSRLRVKYSREVGKLKRDLAGKNRILASLQLRIPALEEANRLLSQKKDEIDRELGEEKKRSQSLITRLKTVYDKLMVINSMRNQARLDAVQEHCNT